MTTTKYELVIVNNANAAAGAAGVVSSHYRTVSLVKDDGKHKIVYPISSSTGPGIDPLLIVVRSEWETIIKTVDPQRLIEEIVHHQDVRRTGSNALTKFYEDVRVNAFLKNIPGYTTTVELKARYRELEVANPLLLEIADEKEATRKATQIRRTWFDGLVKRVAEEEVFSLYGQAGTDAFYQGLEDIGKDPKDIELAHKLDAKLNSRREQMIVRVYDASAEIGDDEDDGNKEADDDEYETVLTEDANAKTKKEHAALKAFIAKDGDNAESFFTDIPKVMVATAAGTSPAVASTSTEKPKPKRKAVASVDPKDDDSAGVPPPLKRHKSVVTRDVSDIMSSVLAEVFG